MWAIVRVLQIRVLADFLAHSQPDIYLCGIFTSDPSISGIAKRRREVNAICFRKSRFNKPDERSNFTDLGRKSISTS